MKITRRDTLLLMTAASALAVTGAGPALAKDGDLYDIAKLMSPAGGVADHVLGSADAPVTVIEYASPTCPHCARFSMEVMPELKSLYIDTGLVKYIMRPFLRNIPDAVVFLLAEAAGPDNYHNVIDTYFKTQDTWAIATSPREPMLTVAKQLGFTPESFDAALTNQTLFNGMEAVRQQALDDFKLEGTPTFYINGKQLTGEKTLEDLAAEIDPLLPADKRPVHAPKPADSTTPATPAETSTPVAPAETSTPVAPDATTPAAPAGGTMAPETPAAPAQ